MKKLLAWVLCVVMACGLLVVSAAAMAYSDPLDVIIHYKADLPKGTAVGLITIGVTIVHKDLGGGLINTEFGWSQIDGPFPTDDFGYIIKFVAGYNETDISEITVRAEDWSELSLIKIPINRVKNGKIEAWVTAKANSKDVDISYSAPGAAVAAPTPKPAEPESVPKPAVPKTAAPEPAPAAPTAKYSTITNNDVDSVNNARVLETINGTGYVGIRYLARFFGDDNPQYNTSTREVTINGFTADGSPLRLIMTLNNPTASVGGRSVDIAAYLNEIMGPNYVAVGSIVPLNSNGAIYLPLRAAVNMFGGSIVDFNIKGGQVTSVTFSNMR